MQLFAALRKVDESKRQVVGTACSEAPDSQGEVWDFDTSRPLFEAWNAKMARITDGKSLGPIREMHQLKAIGKIVDIGFDAVGKKVDITAKIVDESAWQKVLDGVLSMMSIGGKYVKTWPDPKNPKFTRYSASPEEISLVDCGSNPDAVIQQVFKADGTTHTRTIGTQVESELPPFLRRMVHETREAQKMAKLRSDSSGGLGLKRERDGF